MYCFNFFYVCYYKNKGQFLRFVIIVHFWSQHTHRRNERYASVLFRSFFLHKRVAADDDNKCYVCVCEQKKRKNQMNPSATCMDDDDETVVTYDFDEDESTNDQAVNVPLAPPSPAPSCNTRRPSPVPPDDASDRTSEQDVEYCREAMRVCPNLPVEIAPVPEDKDRIPAIQPTMQSSITFDDVLASATKFGCVLVPDYEKVRDLKKLNPKSALDTTYIPILFRHINGKNMKVKINLNFFLHL